MLMLSSMTGASAETRLVLIAWLSIFGNSRQVADKDSLAFSLGVSKPHLKTALVYLEREKYLHRIKVFSSEKLIFQDFYTVTSEALILWKESIDRTTWSDGFQRALFNLKQKAEDSTSKRKKYLIKERLVRALLVFHANSAGYTLDVQMQGFSEALGMTVVDVQKTIMLLEKKGHISIRSVGVTPSSLFDKLSPIYEMNVSDLGYKPVKLGFKVHDFQYQLDGFSESLSRIRGFIRNNTAGKKSNQFPENNIVLQQCLEKITEKKLSRYLGRLCIATVFTFVPIRIEQLNQVDEFAKSFSRKKLNDSLREAISWELYRQLLKMSAEDKLTKIGVLLDRQNPFVKFFMNELVEDVFFIVHCISESVAYFYKVNGKQTIFREFSSKGILNGYLYSIPETEDSNGISNKKGSSIVIRAFDIIVLNVFLKDTVRAQDCFVGDGELLAVEYDFFNSKSCKIKTLNALAEVY